MKVAHLGLSLVLLVAGSQGATAITAEVARACNELVAKAFPPRQVGNPAAGSTKGGAREQRDFFNKCVANGGKMDAESPQQNSDKKSN